MSSHVCYLVVVLRVLATYVYGIQQVLIHSQYNACQLFALYVVTQEKLTVSSDIVAQANHRPP